MTVSYSLAYFQPWEPTSALPPKLILAHTEIEEKKKKKKNYTYFESSPPSLMCPI
jgi:hypothetical protein